MLLRCKEPSLSTQHASAGSTINISEWQRLCWILGSSEFQSGELTLPLNKSVGCVTHWLEAGLPSFLVSRRSWQLRCKINSLWFALNRRLSGPLSADAFKKTEGQFLDTFALLRKAIIGFAMYVCLTVRWHRTTRVPLNGLSWKLTLDYFFENKSKYFQE